MTFCILYIFEMIFHPILPRFEYILKYEMF